MYDFKELDDYLTASLDGFGIDCLSVAVSNKGKTVYETYKNTEKSEYKSFGDFTRLNVGAIAGTIIGVLIIQLIESGKITAYDSIKKHIPEFAYEDVRIIHLLTHTSGLITTANLTPVKSQKEYYSQIYTSQKQVSPLGISVAEYEDGVAILVDLIQRVTGTPIREFAHEHIFKPLDLRRTSFGAGTLTKHNVIMPFDAQKNDFVDGVSLPMSPLFTVAGDLLKFGNLFSDYFNGRKINIMTDAGFQFALTPTYFDAEKRFPKTPVFLNRAVSDQYLCFGDLSSPNTVGCLSSTGCMLSIDLDNDVVIVITSNSCQLSADPTHFKKIINRAMAAFKNKR